MNHSSSPNTGLPGPAAGEVTTIALRDIAADEELTCDYRAFDASAAGGALEYRLAQVPAVDETAPTIR